MKKYLSILSVAFVALLTLVITPACKKKDAPKKDYLDGKTFEMVEETKEEHYNIYSRMTINFDHPNCTITGEDKQTSKVDNEGNIHTLTIIKATYTYASTPNGFGVLTFNMQSGEEKDLLAKTNRPMTKQELDKAVQKVGASIRVNEKEGEIIIVPDEITDAAAGFRLKLKR